MKVKMALLCMMLALALPMGAMAEDGGLATDDWPSVYDRTDISEQILSQPNAMTAERAEALVKAAASSAAKARQFWVYPQDGGAWVFFATGWNAQTALFEGEFWYVDEDKQVQLGQNTKNVRSWSWYDCDPPVFYSDTYYGGKNHPHAAILKDGEPVEIADLGALEYLNNYYGSLYSVANDKVFLGVQDDRLVEIAAVQISREDALKVEGMQEILDTLQYGDADNTGGVSVNRFLFRNATPSAFRNANGNIQGSITLAVDQGGESAYVYVFIDTDGAAHAEKGWDEDIVIWEGEPRLEYDVGLEIVETVTE